MPLFTEAARDQCDDEKPCLPPPSQFYCVGCQARDVLTPDDWQVVHFYGRVQDQYINQTPMGVKDGSPVLTPRLEGWEAALRIYGFPEADWRRLMDGALLLHRCVHSASATRQVLFDAGYRYDTIRPEDVADGDPD